MTKRGRSASRGFCLERLPLAGAALLAILCASHLFSASGEIDKKIKTHQKELKKLQDQIRDLESEKGKLKREEDQLSKTLKRLESEIQQSAQKQVRLAAQIRENESQIRKIFQEIRFFSGERSKWDETVAGDLRAYFIHATAAGTQRLQTDPMRAWVLRAMILERYQNMKSAEASKHLAETREEKLLRYKKNLVGLQAKLKAEIEKQRESQAEKNKLYKTTQGRRIIAEQEAERLRETSDSLESMITKLERKKAKDLASRREAEHVKKSLELRKGNFDWPAQGQVVSSFGKQQRADLNVTVINNGIRVAVAPRSPVKSVAKGAVIYASDFRSYGQTVIVDHGGEIYTIYGLLGEIGVQEGEQVPAGKAVGKASSDQEPQIYFELRNQGRPENPMLWLK